jgi:hypothetical protein
MGIHSEESNKVALIQIATYDRIFLLDIVVLFQDKEKNLYEQDCRLFVEKFLFNKRIIKLGYGFTHDIKMIVRAFVEIQDFDPFRQSVLDLAYLVQQVNDRF